MSKALPNLSVEIERMLSMNSIREVLSRCLRGVDRSDAALVRAAFHDDAAIHHGGGMGDGTPDQFASYVVTSGPSRYDSTMHCIHQSVFDFLDTESAWVETYVTAVHKLKDGDRADIDLFGGRFVEKWERRDGEWKIAERTILHEWDHAHSTDGVVAWRGKFVTGERCPNDLTYTHGA